MRRSPEQEAARRDRQARERAIPRCSVSGCSQAQATRSAERHLCGQHLRDHEERREKVEQRDDILDRIDTALTIEDLRGVLREIVERIDA